MGTKVKKAVDITVESINFIIISYALSSVAMSFRESWIYILFFAYNVWLIGRYYDTVNKVTKSKIITGILCAVCLLIFCLMVYFVGYIDGEITQFQG